MGYKNSGESVRGRKQLMKTIVIALVVLLTLSVFVNTDFIAFGKTTKKHNSIYANEENESRIQINKYANYIHFQPEWNSYPKNLIFEITNVWNKTSTDYNEIEKQYQRGAKTNVNTLQYLEDKPYLEVQYDYIDCNYQWIHYARSGLDILGSKLDYVTGQQLESDHNSALFSHIPGKIENKGDSNLSYYSQFIPICTSKEKTVFDYGVRIDDKAVNFDVYFVSSITERFDYHNNKDNFSFYPNCLGLNYQSFSGTCNNVENNSGLLVIIPDTLNKPLTKISVKLKEIDSR